MPSWATPTTTLEHLDLDQAISEARVRSETEALRDALIGSVSHQLRTPLVYDSRCGNADQRGTRQQRRSAARVACRYPARRGRSAQQRRAGPARRCADFKRGRQAGFRVGGACRYRQCRGRPAAAPARRPPCWCWTCPSELPLVYVDPILLEQALGQIIDNAAKYSQPGSVDHRCCQEPEAASVVLSVKDDGIGLVGEERTRLWERFFRGERHASNVSGIGPRTVDRESLRDREWRRDRSCQRGRRSRHARVNTVCRQQNPRCRTLRRAAMSNATILVIDDELHIRQFLRAAFEFEGFTVQEAGDAEEGIRSATLKPPDLIILDLGLPDRDGASIIERLRSWSNIPIIVLTVRSREREKVRLLELGADDYVVKPFGIGELIARARCGAAAPRRCARQRSSRQGGAA